MNVGFITFASGDIFWKFATLRITRQAFKSDQFEKIGTYNSRDLEKIAASADLNFIKGNPHGYGYWLWKPIVILDFLSKNPHVEKFLYADTGCDLNFNSKSVSNWSRYLNYLEMFECVAFKMELIEKSWTKEELFRAFPPFCEHRETEQILGGVFLMNRKFAIEFCNLWLSNMRTENYKLLDDSYDPHIQVPGFRHHRHDQSFFSLMSKCDERVLVLDSLNEVYFEPNWDVGMEYPIWTSRNKSFIPKSRSGKITKFLRSIERILKRFLI